MESGVLAELAHCRCLRYTRLATILRIPSLSLLNLLQDVLRRLLFLLVVIFLFILCVCLFLKLQARLEVIFVLVEEVTIHRLIAVAIRGDFNLGFNPLLAFVLIIWLTE